MTLILLLAGAVAAPGALAADPSPSFSPPQIRLLAAVDSLHAARQVAAVDSLLDTASAEPVDDGGAYELELLVRRGRLYTSFGRSAEGVEVLTRSTALAEARGDSLNLTRSVRWLSLAESLQGQSERACVLYRRLRNLAVARGDSLHEGWALVGLGWDALNRGHLADARTHYGRSVSLFAGIGDHDAEIWARNGYALVLQRQGDYQTALAIYRELMDVAGRTGYAFVEAMAHNNTGSLLQKLGDPGAAVPHYERSRDLQLALHQPREAVIPSLNIAVCLINQGRPAEAAELLHELDQRCTDEGFPDLRANVIYELARARELQNRFTEAAALHRRIVTMDAELPVGSRVRHLTGLARVQAEMDSTAAGLMTVERARREYLERTAGSERLMLELAYGQRLADVGRSARALAALDAVAGEAAASGLTGYRVAARTRGGSIHLAEDRPDSALAWFRLAAAAWETERGLPLDPRWREQRGTNAQQIYPRLADLLLREDDPGVAHDAVHAFKARTLSETMLGPGAYGAPVQPTAATEAGCLSELQRNALRPGEIFLDYYLGPEGSFVFAVTTGTVRAARLAALPQVADLFANYRAVLATDRPGGNDGSAAAQRVAQVLFAGIEDLVGTATAIIWAPDGPLHRIPLATLPSPGGPRAGALLATTHTITRVPSASALLHQRGQPAGVPTAELPSILAVAGTRGADGTALAGPRREAEDLQHAYAAVRIMIDPEPDRLLAGQPEDILHLAAHALIDPLHPWRSAFVLGDDPVENLLRAGAVAREQLPYRLAVLASCESVGSQALVGEGQLGLSSAFLGAGVPAVVATLWPVTDRTATAFSGAFYAALAEGLTTAQALQSAQSVLRGAADSAHPGAWASFVLAGEGDTHFPLQKRAGGLGGWWLVMAGALVAGVIVSLRIRAG
ncbi:MAG: CHAT domain-containing protein [bacterium]|nr:CHAT domain-containing protein [bacterium]